jgi:hypothetical protein
VELLVGAEDEDGDIGRAEDGQLVGLFEETKLALQEGDRAIAVILDGLDLNLPTTHVCGGCATSACECDGQGMLGATRGAWEAGGRGRRCLRAGGSGSGSGRRRRRGVFAMGNNVVSRRLVERRRG